MPKHRRKQEEGFDLGDFIEKVAKCVNSAYEKGGVKLVLIVIGAIIVVPSILLGAMLGMANWTFAIAMLIGVGFIAAGVILAVLEKKNKQRQLPPF